MLTTRVIPCLLLRNQGLVKTVKFKDPNYVGDPINAVKTFTEMEVDAILFLDTRATIEEGPTDEGHRLRKWDGNIRKSGTVLLGGVPVLLHFPRLGD